MNGRKRAVQIKFRVTEAERDLILEKTKLIPTDNITAYLRKIAIDGYIIQVEHTDIKAMPPRYKKSVSMSIRSQSGQTRREMCTERT